VCLKKKSVEEEEEEEDEVDVERKKINAVPIVFDARGGVRPARRTPQGYIQASCPVAQRVLVILGLTGVLSHAQAFTDIGSAILRARSASSPRQPFCFVCVSVSAKFQV
jgi:hypothetical protein